MIELKENGNCWKFLPPKRGKFIFANLRPKNMTSKWKNMERTPLYANMASTPPPPWDRYPKQHASILEAIPKDWKDLNTEIGKPDEIFCIKVGTDTESKIVTQLNCKTLYNILMTDDTSKIDHTHKAKWTITPGPVNWTKILKNIQKSNYARKANDLWCKNYIGVFLLLKD